MVKFLTIESGLRRSGFFYIAGVDEAGRGPLAGPVVCSAVILKPNAKIPGLNDSKKLTPKKREALFSKIIANALAYSITIVSPILIDELNILEAVKVGNFQAVDALNITPDIVLLDGRDKQILTLPHKTIVKGDQKVKLIAAASVLAKVTRDKIMDYYADLDKKYARYGFKKHKGYGTEHHYKMIKKYGICDIHRKSYNLKK